MAVLPASTHARIPSSQRGATMLLMLFLVLALGGFCYATFMEGLGAKNAVVHLETSTRALEIAEMGLLEAEIEVRTQLDPDGNGIGNLEGSYGGGSYSVQVTHDPLKPDFYNLVSVAINGHSVRRVETELRRIPHTPFVHALFAKNDLVVGGNPQTDAFDSRLGTWAAQATNSDAAGPYAEGGGDVGANNALTVEGTSTIIRGSARHGPLGSITINGSPTIWDSTAPLPEEIDLPDIAYEEYQAALASNDNNQLVGVPGYDPATLKLQPGGKDTVTLSGGTYFFTDVIFEGKTQLIVTGPSKLYVTGAVVLKGGSIQNQTGFSGNLMVLAHPYPLPAGHQWVATAAEPNQIVVEGGAGSSLVLYAPSADARLAGNADLIGAFIANNIQVEGTPAFHYDKALGYIAWPAARFSQRVYWLERTVPPR